MRVTSKLGGGLAAKQKNDVEVWEEMYEKGEKPWDVGEPEAEIVRYVESSSLRSANKVLELGCGTGTDSIYLANRGFSVVGIDFSSLAINEAEEKARTKHLAEHCHFYPKDACDLASLKNKFDFAYDRTCFDNIDSTKRLGYVRSLRSALAPKAKFLLLAISDKDKNTSNPRFSENQLRTLFGRQFQVISLKRRVLKHRSHEHEAWKMLLEVCSK
jgi:cyclopropane fatty-acyl-phospholipid synthase-like methyltransferase